MIIMNDNNNNNRCEFCNRVKGLFDGTVVLRHEGGKMNRPRRACRKCVDVCISMGGKEVVLMPEMSNVDIRDGWESPVPFEALREIVCGYRNKEEKEEEKELGLPENTKKVRGR